MDVRARLVQTFPGVTHHAELVPLLDMLAGTHHDRTEMAVKAVVFAPVEPMLDHDVTPVVRPSRRLAGVHDHARRNSAHGIERLSAGVALEGLDVDSFVQAGVDDSGRSLGWIADKAVAAAFPRRGF